MSLGVRPPTSTNQLLNIATNFASSEETVGATFSDGSAKGKQKAKATETSGSQDPKKEEEGLQGEARMAGRQPHRRGRSQEPQAGSC